MVKKLLSSGALLFAPALGMAQSNDTWRTWPGPWHMWAGGWGFWWVFPLLMLVFFGFCMFFMMARHGHSPRAETKPSESALRILGERFARGEIDRNEYDERKATLLR